MKSESVAIIALAVFTAAMAPLSVPAQASSGCVTRGEYRAAKSAWRLEGLSLSGVHSYFGFKGTLISKRDAQMTRRYRGCAGSSGVTVQYRYVQAQAGRAWMSVRFTSTGNDTVTLCTSAGGTSKYPFNFLLTTSQANSKNSRVRTAVRSVQKALRGLGIRDTKGQQVIIDGSYGSQTAAAVRRFQRRTGITVDGKVGSQTWGSLGQRYC